MINDVTLYGKLKGSVDVAQTRTGRLKLTFELAVRRPPWAPPKRDREGRLIPDFVPVVVQGRVAKLLIPRLEPWIGNGDELLGRPYLTVHGIWATHTSGDSDNGRVRVHHECLAYTVIVHTSRKSEEDRV